MAIEITIALIALLGTIVGGFLNYLYSKKNQEDAQRNQKSIALLNSKLEEKRAEKDARRDYVFDARKRLYEECEPLFFLLNEMSQRAAHRIKGFARTAREGDLTGEKSWLKNEGYYLVSTLFFTISPLAIFKLMQNRLTFVDLSVDSKVKTRYELMKQVYLSFAAPHKIAKIEPSLTYDPNTNDLAKRFSESKEYWPQGMYIGRLDNAIESLIVEGPKGQFRCMSYGQFENEFYKKKSKVRNAFSEVRNLFLNFHPKTRPVLWRILIIQTHLYLALDRACKAKESNMIDSLKPLIIIPKDQRKEFDWRSSEKEASDKEVFEDPFEVAKKYFEIYLSQFLE